MSEDVCIVWTHEELGDADRELFVALVRIAAKDIIESLRYAADYEKIMGE